MHVIFGATGRVGGAAIDALLRRGETVRAVVRDPGRGERLARSGCALAVARLGDLAAVQRAIAGADGVVTRAATGISGVTALSPALTVARQRGIDTNVKNTNG